MILFDPHILVESFVPLMLLPVVLLVDLFNLLLHEVSHEHRVFVCLFRFFSLDFAVCIVASVADWHFLVAMAFCVAKLVAAAFAEYFLAAVTVDFLSTFEIGERVLHGDGARLSSLLVESEVAAIALNVLYLVQ